MTPSSGTARDRRVPALRDPFRTSPLRRSPPIPRSRSAARWPSRSPCPCPIWRSCPAASSTPTSTACPAGRPPACAGRGCRSPTSTARSSSRRSPAGASITHLVFEGLDGFRAPAVLEDALADDVLIAENLDGQPLGRRPRRTGPAGQPEPVRLHEHQAPVPDRGPHRRSPGAATCATGSSQFGLQLVKPHRRARVWEEERHQHLPARVVRPVYRLLIRPIKMLSARGSRR